MQSSLNSTKIVMQIRSKIKKAETSNFKFAKRIGVFSEEQVGIPPSNLCFKALGLKQKGKPYLTKRQIEE